MMLIKRWLLFFFGITLSPILFAWDSNGHKLVAEIAYENLSPTTQKTVLQLLQTPGPGYTRRLSFSNSAAWADWIRADMPQYSVLHYINLPYCGSRACFYKKTAEPNIVTAILQEALLLQDQNAAPAEKGAALRFYLHWLGDIHQPMHTISYYSPSYPQGDAGGNLYLLQDDVFPNLHAFWDDACGLWPQNRSLSKNQLQALAKRWQGLYPQRDFSVALADHNPLDWAKDSHALAVEYAYEAAPQHYLSLKAQKKAQIICQKQIVLAGYRLAQSLNAWYAVP
jgi:hypothetical protein